MVTEVQIPDNNISGSNSEESTASDVEFSHARSDDDFSLLSGSDNDPDRNEGVARFGFKDDRAIQAGLANNDSILAI